MRERERERERERFFVHIAPADERKNLSSSIFQNLVFHKRRFTMPCLNEQAVTTGKAWQNDRKKRRRECFWLSEVMKSMVDMHKEVSKIWRSEMWRYKKQQI